jgi:oligopeptide transport system substrate-binding protein
VTAARLFLALLALAALGSCVRAAHRPPCPAGALCMLYGNGAEPSSLDPAHIGGVWEAAIVNEMLLPLLERDPDGRIVPGLAESWSMSPDGLSWTFHLRRAVWSDGSPVTADDLVFAMRRVIDPKTASDSAFLLFPVKNAEAISQGKAPTPSLGVEATDAHTVVIRLEHVWLSLPMYAVSRVMQAVPRAAVMRWGDAWTSPAHFLADGPFRLQVWRLGDKVVLRRNPTFVSPGPDCFSELDFFPWPDAISNERKVRAGELDLSSIVQSNRISYLRRSDLARALRLAPQFGVSYLAFNLKHPPLADVRVRQALSMSIDRRFITDKLLRAGQQPALGFIPPGLPGYSEGALPYWAGWSFTKRQAEARRLLAAAGYGPDHPLTLTLKHLNSADTLLVMPSVQADWKAVGVRAQLQQEDVQVAYQDYEDHDFEVGYGGWLSPDAIDYLDLQRSDTGGQNYGQYENPAYDAAIDAARSTVDPRIYAADLRRAEQILLDDMPVAPLVFASSHVLVTPDITGWTDGPLSSHDAQWLCRPPLAAATMARARG